jgi:hypothetical protein
VARKRKPAHRIRRARLDLAQLKVRLPEWVRSDLERAAKDAGHSMNTEIALRLSRSLVRDESNKTNKLLAQALVRSLDPGIVDEMMNIVRPVDAEHEEYVQKLLDRDAEAEGDAYMELLGDSQREGGSIPEEENSE